MSSKARKRWKDMHRKYRCLCHRQNDEDYEAYDAMQALPKEYKVALWMVKQARFDMPAMFTRYKEIAVQFPEQKDRFKKVLARCLRSNSQGIDSGRKCYPSW